MFNVHIDVRGPWPILVHGVRAYQLEGKYATRSITLELAVDELVNDGRIAYNDPLVDLVNSAYFERSN